MLGDKRFTLTFRWNWLLLVGAIAVALIVTYAFAPDHHPLLVFGASVLAGSAALTTAINALDARASQAEQARISAALSYAERWNAPHLHHAKKSGREIIEEFKKLSTVEQQIAYLNEEPSRLANLIDVLNHFEALSIAIQKTVVDDATAKMFFRSIVLQYWHSSHGYIKRRRADRTNDRLYNHFEALYDKWKD